MSAGQLPYLDTFIKAAELSCFTAAGRTLGCTQAAVSQRIQALERELGTSLFRRRGGRALLTDAGRRLHALALQILDLHDRARQEVAGTRKTPVSGELALAASSVPGEHLLPALLPTFRQRHPHVQMRVTVADTRVVLRQVERGQAHLGLVGGKGDSPHLDFRSFACDEMILVVPAGHAWGRRQRVSAAELCQQPLILREAGSGSRGCLVLALAQTGRSVSDLHVALELGSNEAIKEAVLHGLGAAVLSRYAVAKELEAGTLHALAVTGLPMRRDIFVAWDRRRVLPLPARLFLDLLEPCPGKKKRP